MVGRSSKTPEEQHSATGDYRRNFASCMGWVLGYCVGGYGYHASDDGSGDEADYYSGSIGPYTGYEADVYTLSSRTCPWYTFGLCGGG